MVSRNNAVFRFILDIKDFVTKGQKVVQTLNQVDGSVTRTSSNFQKLGTESQKTGQQMTAAAVNFQTATQGMLNLSTAGVQTFTSFSNLDRAGNRLAQSQIAVARAQDLLNNKQLRLNQLQAQGLGNTQKAALLTNELATARADLAVKTDKLKIEEGALFDIQLLFATNIANVMISSLQTIKTLKDLHIASTIKQVIHEKLLATTLFTKSIPAQYAQVGAMRVYDTAAKTVINTNRLLTLSIPIVGGAIVGASLAFQAYTENIGGFRDAVQTVLPFLKDKKELLRDVQSELSHTNDSWQSLTMGMERETKKQEGILNRWVLINKLAALETQGFVESGGVVSFRQDFSTPDTKSGGIKIPKTAGHMVLGALALAGTDPIKSFIDLIDLKLFPPEPKYLMKNPNVVAVGPTGSPIGTIPVSMRNPQMFQQIQPIINQPGGGMTTIIGGVPTEVQVTQSGVPFIGGSRFVDNFPTEIIGRTEQNYIQEFEAKYPGAFGKKITGSPAEIQFELEGVQKRLEELSGDNSARAQAEKAVISQLIVFQKNRLNELGKGISPLEFKPGQTGFREAEQRGKIPLAWPFNIQSPMMQKGTLLLPGTGSRLLDPNEPLRRIFYGGNGGKALAYYQLNTGASFGSDSHVLRTLELNQLAGTTPEGRRVNINVDHLVKRDSYGRPNTSVGAGLTQAQIAAGATYTDLDVFRGDQNRRIKVPAWVRENIARKNAFGKSEDFLWYNALRGLAGEKTGAMGRTLADKVARGDARGPNLSGGMGLLSFFGLDAEIQGEASEALASINLNDPNASSLIRSAVNRINNNIKTKTASISAVPGSIGIDFKVGEFERVAVGARSRTIRRGTSRLTRTVYRYGDRLKRAFSPAEIERQIRQDIMWGGFTLTSGFLDNVQLLAEMGSTNFNNTGIISEASAKLNLNENQVFNIRFNPQRGDIELQDRIRWTDRLNTISTGAIVI